MEGANILTRTMIIFGQGAIRCHPFVQGEMKGAFEKDVELFDRSFFGHVGFVFQNVARSLVLGLTGGAFASSPVSGPTAGYYKQLGRLSAVFALSSDVAMGTLGGLLKRKEALTGRLADVLAWMYIASAALKRFRDEGENKRDLPYVHWVCQHALFEAQQAYFGFLQNLPLRPAAWGLRLISFPFGRAWAPPSDRLAHRAARGILDGGEAREHLTRGIYLPSADERGLGLLEASLEKVVQAQAIQGKIRDAVKKKTLEGKPRATLADRALEAKVIDQDELAVLNAAERARQEAVAVDAFRRRPYARDMSA